MNSHQDIKIGLFYKDMDNNIQIETVWAEKIGDYYRIVNIPFFASGVSYGDIVSAEADGEMLFFDELVTASGHTTIQMIFFDKTIIIKTQRELLTIGCDWEESHIEGYVSLDIPPEVNYCTIVKKYLDEGCAERKWDYKEATLAHR